MKPSRPENEEVQRRLFETRLDSFLNKRHELIRLAQAIDWSYFDTEFGSLYAEDRGRPPLPTRLMAGLTYLKYTFDVSDEAACAQFLESGYWQYFCGFEYFQHELPCDPTSLVRWRKRIGEKGAEKLLRETVETAKRKGLLTSLDVSRVVVDTTVQEKAIAFPTDGRLYHKMRAKLVREAKRRGLHLRQSYLRLSKRSLAKSSGYAHAQQMRRARKETKRLKVFLGRVIRDIDRKLPLKDSEMMEWLTLATRIFHQQRGDTNKIYSVHAPEVECISKGKAHKRYEFGVKVSLVTTNKKGFIVGTKAFTHNPFDGHTLKSAIEQAEQLTGFSVRDIFVDRGYRGSNHWPQGKNVFLSGRRGLKASLKRWLRRRSAIEPIIGHVKHDHRMKRNYLMGKTGDQINAMLASSAFNLMKTMHGLLLSFFRSCLGRAYIAATT
jgi:IS5 family transposase